MNAYHKGTKHGNTRTHQASIHAVVHHPLQVADAHCAPEHLAGQATATNSAKVCDLMRCSTVLFGCSQQGFGDGVRRVALRACNYTPYSVRTFGVIEQLKLYERHDACDDADVTSGAQVHTQTEP
jgi:hypothetical protein